jgi:dGTPase
MSRQRQLLAELVAALDARGPDALDTAYADDWKSAVDDAGRRRAIVDQVASLTDASALAWHARFA